MESTKYLYSEQESGSNIITMFTNKGYEVTLEQDLIQYIEDNKLNVTKTGNGLTCDPNCRECEVAQDPSEYIDQNWDSVTEMFYNSKFKK